MSGIAGGAQAGLRLEGSIQGMAKEKVTITLDRAKAAEAGALVAARSTSEVIDVALDRLIRAERLRRDVAAYAATPATDGEIAIAALASADGLTDDTDWELLYAEGET